MIVDNVYVVGVALSELKTHAIFIVDPNSMLTFAVLIESVKLISGSTLKSSKPRCRVHHIELS